VPEGVAIAFGGAQGHMHKRGLNSIDRIARVLPPTILDADSPFSTFHLTSAASFLCQSRLSRRDTAITTGVGLMPPVLKWLSLRVILRCIILILDACWGADCVDAPANTMAGRHV